MSMEADTKNTPVVDVSVEDPLNVSMEGDDGPVWDEAPRFSVETCPSDCVSVNLWYRAPLYEDPGVGKGGLHDSKCPDRLCVGASRVKTRRMPLVKSLMACS